MTKTKGRRLKEILWKCLVLGHRPPHEFDGSKWVSAGGSEYPIDIVLGLEKVCNVYKVVIEVSEPFVPTKIELSLGLGDSKLETNYKNARLAEFSEPVSMEFDARRGHSGQQTTETKNAFLDSSGQYLWMLVHGPSNVRNNPDRQVGINSLTILGYTLNDDEVAEIDGGDAKTGKKAHQRPHSSSAPQKRTPVERYSYNGDGMKTGDGGLASDPLTTVRLVKKIISDKMETAKENDREVEATLCLRATQRLAEYEAMLEDLSHRRSNAIVHNDIDEAEKIRVTMADCRDTVLRSTQVDLLLGRDELRAIGVNSVWAPSD